LYFARFKIFEACVFMNKIFYAVLVFVKNAYAHDFNNESDITLFR